MIPDGPADFTYSLILDATQLSIFAGYYGIGLNRFSTESSDFISRMPVPKLITSKMWSQDGLLHVFGEPDVVKFWDTRAQLSIDLLEVENLTTIATCGWSNHNIIIGTQAGCTMLDVRNPSVPIWTIPTHNPVTHITYHEDFVSIFTGNPANPSTEISAFDISSSSRIRLGEHSIPFRLSAVGSPSDGTSNMKGCIFSVKRTKRS